MTTKTEPQRVNGMTPLERAQHEHRIGVWLIARTPITKTYRCGCSLGRKCGKRCWCAGRTDWDAMPTYCCSRPTQSKDRGTSDRDHHDRD